MNRGYYHIPYSNPGQVTPSALSLAGHVVTPGRGSLPHGGSPPAPRRHAAALSGGGGVSRRGEQGGGVRLQPLLDQAQEIGPTVGAKVIRDQGQSIEHGH